VERQEEQGLRRIEEELRDDDDRADPAPHPRMAELFCAGCGKQGQLAPISGGLVEAGPWDGKQYEDEQDAYGLRCKCGQEFFVP